MGEVGVGWRGSIEGKKRDNKDKFKKKQLCVFFRIFIAEYIDFFMRKKKTLERLFLREY